MLKYLNEKFCEVLQLNFAIEILKDLSMRILLILL